jgi:uncharacterized lipoprotein YddW (UPF0748 family)
MSFRLRSLLLFFSVLIFISGCSSLKKTEEPTPVTREEVPQQVPEVVIVEDAPPVSPLPAPAPEPEEIKEYITRPKTPVMKEFRAAWVATVANINWPSKPGLTTADQQKEAIKLLDHLKDYNFNAVIFQIRPQADALYQSDIEPWSYYLTGQQGKAPEPYYDPLSFWTKEAHDRGIEMHVWLNPYRAHHSTKGEISEKSIIKTNPELVVKLKDGQYWMDPAQKGVQDRSSAVVMDIVKRYDIDGVHFDDYFYPYDSYNGGADFPDDVSWKKYQNDGGKLTRGDWRRESVNIFIKRIYQEIKAEKPHVKFGLSPFGIWRPGFPEFTTGYDQYDKLYADAKLWLNEGWIDYYTPQLYWKINQIPQSFPVLLGWWESENTKNRHLWPGMNVGRGGDEKNSDEVINQIMITRGMLPDSKGAVHWSIGPLLKHPDLSKALIEGPYKNSALVPASPWLDTEVPAVPVVASQTISNKLNVTWTHENKFDVFRWVVYYRYNNGPWQYKILSKNESSVELPKVQEEKKETITHIAVTAVNRTGNESDFKEIRIK